MMDLSTFDDSKYAEQAQRTWGAAPQWREFEEKSAAWTAGDRADAGRAMAEQFAAFGALRAAGEAPGGAAAQTQVRALQACITQRFYTCTDSVLAGLGRLYAGGGDFAANIDAAGGAGTAAFAAEAIRICCEA